MATPATDDGNNNNNNNNLADKLQDQFRNIPASPDQDEAKRAMINAMGRVMGVPGEALLVQAGVLPQHGAKEKSFVLLDNACGTGLIAGLLQEKASPVVLQESRIVCADLNANLVDIIKWRAEKDEWKGAFETKAADAQVRFFSSASPSSSYQRFAGGRLSLLSPFHSPSSRSNRQKRKDKAHTIHLQDTGLPANSFSHVVINFAMHIIPNPEAALRGMHLHVTKRREELRQCTD